MGLPPTLLALVSNSVFQALILIPLALVALDLATGIAASVSRGTFAIQKLPDFLSRDILKYAGGAFLVLLSWFFFSSSIATTLTATLGMSTLSLSVITSVWHNLHEVFGHDPLSMTLIDVAASEVGLHDPGPAAAAAAAGTPDPVGPGIPVSIGPSAVLPPASFDQWNTNPMVPILSPTAPPGEVSSSAPSSPAAPAQNA